MGLLDGKRLLITGVITDASLAFHVAKVAQEQGAQVVLTGFGRMRLVERIAQRLPAARAGRRAGRVEPGAARQPRRARLAEHLGRRAAAWTGCCTPSASPRRPAWARARSSTRRGRTWRTTIQVSAYSFKSLATALLPLLGPGASIVGMDFDNRQAWPAYDWMGVAKSTLESVTRYLARDLGPAGDPGEPRRRRPVKTMAAKSIPGFAAFEDAWDGRAPLGWDVERPGAGGEDGVRAAVGLAAGDHRVDGVGGRRVPRDRASEPADRGRGPARARC